METPIVTTRRQCGIGARCVLSAGIVCALLMLSRGMAPSRAGAATKGRQESAAAKSVSQPPTASVTAVADQSRLPEKVAAMREAILAAARSGVIESLRTPLEWNELVPEIAAAPVGDPIAYWKKSSADGEGRQILAVLVEILESPPVVIGAGTAGERYVWPGVAEHDLTTLTPAQEVQLYRLVSPDEVKSMREAKRWSWYRLTIGADGTWHSFLATK